MTKEQWKIFKEKQNELFEKYKDSTDPNSYNKMNDEWLEFVKNFNSSTKLSKIVIS